MKKVFILFFALCAIPTAFGADSAKTDEKTPPKEEKSSSVDFSKVTGKVSEALCKKMNQCSPGKMSSGQCISEVKGTFEKSYDSLPKEKRFEVAAPDLDLCVKSIQGSSCEEIKAAQTLKGCDFIQQLPPTS